MPRLDTRPTMDLAAGREVLKSTLPHVLNALRAPDLESLGWHKPNENTLLIPMRGSYGGKEDDYLLKLHFRTGREWPPSAQFVNLDTLTYDPAKDQGFLPKLQSNQCNMHSAYETPDHRTIQLICCSATFEFYDVLHGIDNQDLLWKDTDTFLVTISAIERAMSSHYHGRMARNDG